MDIFSEERIIPGAGDLPITFDVTFNPNNRNMPIVVFCHGFKGFKDWGAWNLVAEKMANAGMFVVKMNFSHNGVRYDDLSDINDPEAFGKNTLSLELEDLSKVIEWLIDDNEEYRHYYDADNINLIGHSRGASTVLLKTIEDGRIQRVITWAGAFNLKKFTEIEDDAIWRERGYTEVQNSRTGDVYRIDYGFREDFLKNAERLDLQKLVMHLDQNLLIIHGNDDPVAPISNSKKVHLMVKHSLMREVEGDHTFGSHHPWGTNSLPDSLEEVVNETIEFIKM